ncbi:hypothetical protein GCM10010193_49260 [Kitasatospora atroaurantiaca]|uniref:MYXO-CTERM domain-containing protein n=1 Tax=Kitasatospora atroaurantiaca TaxID=285545 RepID=A0A561EYL2_9ACTN|nr:hypothetical protein [Kitasatospora atroaurantiaca]TWE20698.1 hypothetical protein FB465_5854 [Kitasatospora atroaurantiaca]
MRSMRTAATALLGATTLLGVTAPAALAKDVEPAWVSPAEAAPGRTVTVSVTCDTSSVRTITANSQAFSTGSATLTVGPDGKYSGPARLASKEEFTAKGPTKAAKDSSWGIDGSCPNGDTFTGAVAVLLVGQSGQAGQSGHTAEAGKTGQAAQTPHGSMKTGLGGSVGTGTRELVTGGALVVAGIGGFWLLRRRTGGDEAQL